MNQHSYGIFYSFAESTKKKAFWAAHIFEQWKCIWNFKCKQDPEKGEMIQGTLLNMEVDQLCNVLCMLLMEIHKQNGSEYPREMLYKIVLSIQHFISINGCNLKLLEHCTFVEMYNTLDNWIMKQLSKASNICE